MKHCHPGRHALLSGSVIVVFLISATQVGADDPTPDRFPKLARPDVEFKVFQFPADRIPRIDGNPNDWEFVPESYSIGSGELRETDQGKGDQLDPDNLDIRVKVGWVDGLNQLYFLYEARDNYWDFANSGLHNDIFEVVIDGDLSGGPLIRQMHPDVSRRDRLETHFTYHGIHAQNYHVFTPAVGKDWAMVWGCQPWIKELPYANAVCKYDFEHGASGRLVLEFFVTPFDHAPADKSRAIPTELKVDNVLGISWSILDHDGDGPGDYSGFWNLSHKTSMYGNASDLVAFRLMPVEDALRDPLECRWSFEVTDRKKRTVAFRDKSYGNITSWRWDFGDDTTSNEQHPVHRYEKAGEFIVTLHVDGPDGTATLSKVWDVTLP